jgi:hypothetical protein
MSEWLHIRTTNDRNGNPRRLWVELADSRVSRVIDEGYKGSAEARAAGMVNYATTIDVSPSEYNAFRKLNPEPVDSTYQGYKNYETFSVDLMLSNDQKWYDETRKLIRKGGRSLDTDLALQLYVEKLAKVEDYGDAPMLTQLATCALSAVDWRELVNLWCDRAEED